MAHGGRVPAHQTVSEQLLPTTQIWHVAGLHVTRSMQAPCPNIKIHNVNIKGQVGVELCGTSALDP